MFDLFPADLIVTANSPEMKPGRGKPCPDVSRVLSEASFAEPGVAREAGIPVTDARLDLIIRCFSLLLDD